MSVSPSRSMPHLRLAAMAVAIGSLLLACQSEEEAAADGGDDASALINGKETASLPSTLRITDGCTAAKVGPRLLLTAAHCAYNLGTLKPKYDATRPITLATTKKAAAPQSYAVTRVIGHPVFLERCSMTLCSISEVAAKLDAPDVAVIEVADEIAGVPVVEVDTRPLAPGDSVVVEGFGCTDGVHLPDARTAPTLKAAEAVIVSAESALHDGSFVSGKDVPIFDGNYVMTSGPGANGALPGLCPGDSGGPLYARPDRKRIGKITKADTLVVVGVNANYTLHPDEVDSAGLPVTNWHTRLDDGSRNHVGEWLASILAAPTAD